MDSRASEPVEAEEEAGALLAGLIYSLANEGPDLQAARWAWVDSVARWDLTCLEEQ